MAKSLTEIRSLARSHTRTAINVLVGIMRSKDATAAANSLLASLSPTKNKARAFALADLTTLAVRTKDFDRANALVGDAVDVTVRTESSIARQRLLTLASTLATSNDPGATSALLDHIVSTLRR